MRTGRVYTSAVVHLAPERFAADVPYQVVIVALEGGGRVTARIEGERVAIDDNDAIAFSSYLGNEGNTREAVLVNKTDCLVEVAAEGAPAPGGGRYAAFGPWPTIGAGGVISFIAALDGAPEPLAVPRRFVSPAVSRRSPP